MRFRSSRGKLKKAIGAKEVISHESVRDDDGIDGEQVSSKSSLSSMLVQRTHRGFVVVVDDLNRWGKR